MDRACGGLLAAVLLWAVSVPAAVRAQPPALSVEDFMTAAEKQCDTLSDAEQGWCYTVAYKKRDQATSEYIRRFPNSYSLSFHISYLKFRYSRCRDRSPSGSGEGTIIAYCMLRAAIVHQWEIEDLQPG